MKTIEEIKNYIEEQGQNGALLVTGKWGSGKTYLMRQIERELNQGPQYLMAVVSLFGIEDTNTLTKKVKETVVYAQTFNKAEKSGKGHIAKGVNVAKQLSEKAAAFGELFDFGKIKKIAKSANMLLSINVYDFLPIEKEVYCIVAGEEQPVKKKLVLVFDDFERCKIGVIDLLGIINTYVEGKGIKTVIIASEDNIDCLAGISLVSNNASVIQVTNHGQIENSFFGLNIRNIRDPLLVRIVSVKLTVQQIVVSMFIIAHLLPLLSAANLA